MPLVSPTSRIKRNISHNSRHWQQSNDGKHHYRHLMIGYKCLNWHRHKMGIIIRLRRWNKTKTITVNSLQSDTAQEQEALGWVLLWKAVHLNNGDTSKRPIGRHRSLRNWVRDGLPNYSRNWWVCGSTGTRLCMKKQTTEHWSWKQRPINELQNCTIQVQACSHGHETPTPRIIATPPSLQIPLDRVSTDCQSMLGSSESHPLPKQMMIHANLAYLDPNPHWLSKNIQYLT